jgi:transposase
MERLLDALVFCYANGITHSGDVAAQIRYDRALQAVVGRHLPDAATIRRFRRSHRQDIAVALENALVGCRPISNSTAAARALEILEEAMLLDTAEYDE